VSAPVESAQLAGAVAVNVAYLSPRAMPPSLLSSLSSMLSSTPNKFSRVANIIGKAED
jgi:hypothetical protein